MQHNNNGEMMDTNELKRLAEAATPGPWRTNPNGCGGIYPQGNGAGILHARTKSGTLPNGDANEAFSAAANPAAVLALIVRITELEAIVGASLADAPTTTQDWAGLSAEVAFSLIERHADTWAQGAQMMTAWADARAAAATGAPDLHSMILAARAEGRAEAVQIITGMDPEDALGELTGWSSPSSPDDEGIAYWDLDKLRGAFSTDDKLYNAFAEADEKYWHYCGVTMEMQWEAEQRRAALASAAPVGAEQAQEDSSAAPITLSDLLSAPFLYAQVYSAARIIYKWPSDAAFCAAAEAVKAYGPIPCKIVSDLENVLREVLSSDGDAPGAAQ